jgi:hypothetical protein
MKTTRQYPVVCKYCAGTGIIMSTLTPLSTVSGNLTERCPVCNGNKTVTFTETIETEGEGQFYPPEFLEWILEFAEKIDIETETEIYHKWVVEVETHIIEEFTTAELFEYWKQNEKKETGCCSNPITTEDNCLVLAKNKTCKGCKYYNINVERKQ